MPADVESLRRLILEHDAALEARDIRLREKDRQIAHLKWQLAKLRRWKFGHSSEQLADSGQLALSLEELAQAIARSEPPAGSEADGDRASREKPVRRKHLPEHFERFDEVIDPPECRCPQCGGALQAFGTADEAEVLEVKTVTFTVRRHIRPKKRCPKCSTIVQASAPARPIEKSFAGASPSAILT